MRWLSRYSSPRELYIEIRDYEISAAADCPVIGEFCVDCGGVSRQYPSGVVICACSDTLPGRAAAQFSRVRAPTLPALSLSQSPTQWTHNPLSGECV